MAVVNVIRVFRGSYWRGKCAARSLFVSRTPQNDCQSGNPSESDKTVTSNPEQPSLTDNGLLEEPTNCCMSGCANCVWIQYAEELIKQVDGGGEMARKVILNRIQDPNMRAFLDMELRTLSKS